MADSSKQRFRTKPAAAYLSEGGLTVSASYLEKCRLRGAEDPRDRGPDWSRDPRGLCWYSKAALDDYIERRLAALQFRAPARQPANFRKAG